VDSEAVAYLHTSVPDEAPNSEMCLVLNVEKNRWDVIACSSHSTAICQKLGMKAFYAVGM